MNNFTQNLSKKPGNRTGIKNIEKQKKSILVDWIREHRDNPYPTEDEKYQLAEATQLTAKQISNWFTNARKRHSSLIDESKLLKAKRRRSALNSSLLNYQRSIQPGLEIQIPHMTQWDASAHQFAMSADKFCFCSIDEDLSKFRHQLELKHTEKKQKHCIDLFRLL
ncbi:unnamed protein product [Moneuplotes crassus]|uniref:Homeobox domain-containing protein n=1 Tax=Euplotes crassus TaxID=5936 RepID=A0AAD1X837_EUPCR|nr:unnamed protein product [Moneuplotes crassus]